MRVWCRFSEDRTPEWIEVWTEPTLDCPTAERAVENFSQGWNEPVECVASEEQPQ